MRYPDWQERFWRAMEAARLTQFEWGSHDCVLYAAKIADAISDMNYVARAQESFHWTSAREAVELLKEKSLQQLVESVMGPMCRWQTLSMGDLVMILDDESMQSLAVHDGVQIVGLKKTGLGQIPFSYAQGGWKVE